MFVYLEMDPGIEMLKGSLQATTVYKQGLVKDERGRLGYIGIKAQSMGF
jgi:hypothetical protein